MADPRTRDRIIELVRQMREHTVENGCTPAEAAGFAAKVQKWIEEYQIGEAELRTKAGVSPEDEEREVCENVLNTGKRAFNHGMTAVVNGLALGSCCRIVMDYRWRGGEKCAVYCVIGDPLDADYVCQIATSVVPALRTMAVLEGAEWGHEGGNLVRWCNQYLMGAGEEIRKRLIKDRRERSEAKKIEAARSCTALAVVTGDVLAKIKTEATEEALKQMYPKLRQSYSRSGYDPEARERGAEAGRRVGLHRAVEG